MRATFRCFAGCPGSAGAEHPLTRALYTCPSCGGLLAVAHDVDALAATPPERWRALFAERGWAAPGPHASGVWSKREWVAPGVTDDDVVSAVEGRTPLCPAPRLGRELGIADLAIKQSGTSHTGSFKDLGMTVLVSVVKQGLREGSLSVRALACASTGDTSAALAAYGAIAGLPVVVLLPRGLVSTAQLVQPLAHGARVLALDTDFDGCMAIIKELAAAGDVYLANSMNPLRIEGQKTVAFEIAEQRGWKVPDWVVLPSGNLGNAAALHAGFSMMLALGVTDRMPRLCVAQAARANPMVTAFREGKAHVAPMRAGETHATAIRIGNPVSAPRAMAALAAMQGVAEEATEDELADAAALADRAGLYACPHTGVAIACAKKLRARGVIAEGQSVVVVSTASGLKFTEFKLAYHERRAADVTSARANEPIALPADVSLVRERIASF